MAHYPQGVFASLFVYFLFVVFMVFHEWPILWPRTILNASGAMLVTVFGCGTVLIGRENKTGIESVTKSRIASVCHG